MQPRSFGTHDGTFHADEVTACALLLLFDKIDRDKIVRTRDLERLKLCEYVCDVGGIYDPSLKKFDHHQVEYRGPLSSAGMVLQYLRDSGDITEEDYTFFNHSLIWDVDAHDNGRDQQVLGLCSYSHVISNFMPISYDAGAEEQLRAFFEALSFAEGHLTRLWRHRLYRLSCKEIVAQAMESQAACLFFDREIPWVESFFSMGGERHPATFLIMPSGDHWKLRGIPPSYQERMKVRVPLPEEWAGMLEKDLGRVSGIPGAIFCHKGRFISVWQTKEDAERALAIILEKTK